MTALSPCVVENIMQTLATFILPLPSHDRSAGEEEIKHVPQDIEYNCMIYGSVIISENK